MELTSQIQALIAVGAAVSANCQPCLQSAVAMALKSGASKQEITEAIRVGKSVREGAASKMDKFASELNFAVPASLTTADCGCE